MLTAVTDLERFDLPLVGGQTMSIWACGYSRHPGELVFSVLADVEPADQESLQITGRSPTNPLRVDVIVARVPTELLAGEWWKDLPEWEHDAG